MVHGIGSRIARLAIVPCVLGCALALGGCSLLTPTISDAQTRTRPRVSDAQLVQKGTLTVGLSTSDAPQSMMDSDGELTGYAVDVARAIAERLGLKVAFVNAASPSDALNGKKIDIYLGPESDAKSDALKVSASYLTSAVSLFGRDQRSSRSLAAADLAGATIGVQDASASQRALTSAGVNSKVKTFGNVNECFAALVDGTIDYVACEATAGAYLSRQYEGASFAGAIASPKEYDILSRSGTNDLSEQIAKVVNDISGNGVLDAIHAAWYGTLPMSLSDRLVSGITPGEASAETNSVLDELGADGGAPSTDGSAGN